VARVAVSDPGRRRYDGRHHLVLVRGFARNQQYFQPLKISLTFDR
jgi:hypothetical protein